MDRLTMFSRFASALGVALALALNMSVQDYMNAHTIPLIVQICVGTVLVVILSVALRAFCESVLMEWRPLRKLLLGGQYIEGRWVNVVRTSQRPPMYGIVHIAADGTSIRYSGVNYSESGELLGDFHTEWTRVDFPNVFFAYINSSGSAPVHDRGVGRLLFEDVRMPCTFTGECLDVNGTISKLEGIRITDDVARSLQEGSDRRSLVAAVAQLLPGA